MAEGRHSRLRIASPRGQREFAYAHSAPSRWKGFRACVQSPLLVGRVFRRVYNRPLGGRMFTHAHHPPSAREAFRARAPLPSVWKGVHACAEPLLCHGGPSQLLPRHTWLGLWFRLLPHPPSVCERVTLTQRHASGRE